MSTDRQSQSMDWDPKDIDIKTKSVEKTLEPLIRNVTTMMNHANRKPRRGYCKKRAIELAEDVEEATQHLVDVGEEIAEDYPDMKEPILDACREAREAGTLKSEQSVLLLLLYLEAI